MHFLQPIWLWAISGIAVPVAIHLWNVRSGKVLKVGSIQLLTESVKAHATSFKLSKILLLVLRCLAIILFAMLLALPVIQSSESAQQKGWVLLERSDLQHQYQQNQVVIDSLLKTGYSFRYFEAGFPKATLFEELKNPADTTARAPADYWTLIKVLDNQVPDSLPVWLCTGNQLQRFKGTRPQISFNLNWQLAPSNDTAVSWLQEAYRTYNDSIRVITGKSDRNGASFKHEVAGAPNSSVVLVAATPLKVAWKYNEKQFIADSIPVDTPSLKVLVYGGERPNDQRYVNAALSAIRDYTRRRMFVQTIKNVTAPVSCNWLFWLSDQPIPRNIKAGNIFRYKKGTPANMKSALFTNGSGESAALMKMVTAAKSESIQTTLWKNSFGDPVLSQSENAPALFEFASRFDPEWTDLVWNGQLPNLLFPILFPSANPTLLHDVRQIDPGQVQPSAGNGLRFAKAAGVADETPLDKVFWTTAFLMILCERVLVFVTQKRAANG